MWLVATLVVAVALFDCSLQKSRNCEIWNYSFLGLRLTLASHGDLDVGDRCACYTPTPQRGDGSSGTGSRRDVDLGDILRSRTGRWMEDRKYPLGKEEYGRRRNQKSTCRPRHREVPRKMKRKRAPQPPERPAIGTRKGSWDNTTPLGTSGACCDAADPGTSVDPARKARSASQ